MTDLKGKKFVASYSGGKDSVLAIKRAVDAGLRPLGLINMFKTDAKRSWFHGMSEDLLQKASESIGIPLSIIRTTGVQYEENYETALKEAKERGAEVCVFGDIDLEGHLRWCSARCENTGMEPYFPMLKEERKKVVYEFIDAGFSAIIKIVDTSRLPDVFLGRTLTREVVDEIEKSGADICGENGEFHTFVFDGPLFKNKVKFTVGGMIMQDKYAVLPLNAQSSTEN